MRSSSGSRDDSRRHPQCGMGVIWLALAFWAACGTGRAVPVNEWTGAGGTVFWIHSSNWSLGHVPNHSEAAKIVTDDTVRAPLSLPPTVAWLTVGAEARLLDPWWEGIYDNGKAGHLRVEGGGGPLWAGGLGVIGNGSSMAMVSGATGEVGSIWLGGTGPGGNATLTLDDARLEAWSATHLGYSPGGATLVVRNGSCLDLNSEYRDDVSLGRDGRLDLLITGGSTVRARGWQNPDISWQQVLVASNGKASFVDHHPSEGYITVDSGSRFETIWNGGIDALEPTDLRNGEAIVNISSGLAGAPDLVVGPTSFSQGRTFMAVLPNATATMTLSGADADWQNGAGLFVGDQGTASLTIQDGASVVVSARESVYGRGVWDDELIIRSAKEATLTVRTGGSLLIWGGTEVGCSGTRQGRLIVDGATFDTKLDLTVGDARGPSEEHSSLAVGPAALVTVGRDLILAGTNTSYTGRLTMTGGELVVQRNAYMGQKGTGTVAQSGGTLSVSAAQPMFVAERTGSTGTYNLSAGTAAVNSSLYVGGGVGSAGGTGELRVSCGALDVSNTLRVWGTGAVNLSGGTLDADTIQHTDGGTLNFTGGTLTAGQNGSGAVAVWPGGQLATQAAVLGANSPSSTTGFVQIFGIGTRWTNSGDLTVGTTPNDRGYLRVATGAELLVGGTLAVGPGSTVDLDVGTIRTPAFDHSQGTFNWTAGTVAFTDDLTIQAGAGFGAAVSVGANKALSVADYLYVADTANGSPATSGGGDVTGRAIVAGMQAGTTGAMSVAGAGSSLLASGFLVVGNSGQSTLDITNGGVASAPYMFVGFSSGGQGTVTVNGVDSRLTVTGPNPLVVGEWGTGVLNVENQAAVDAQNAFVGDYASGTLTVAGFGSRFGCANLQAAAAGGNANITVSDGGTLAVSGDTWLTPRWMGSPVANVTVTGTDSLWHNGGDLYVAGNPSGFGSGTTTVTVENGGELRVDGTLRVWPNGTVNLTGGSITADTVQNTDGGGFTMTGGSLDIGSSLSIGPGGPATVTISDGAVTVGTTITLGTYGSLALAGGTLRANTLDNTAGGTFDFAGGHLFLLHCLGSLANTTGTLHPGSSPGLLEVLGDYAQGSGAWLEIEFFGPAPETEYGVLRVEGDITLDGGLVVALGGGFMPSAGNAFDILDWGGTSTGSFTTLNLPPLSDPDLYWNTSQLYSDGILRVGSLSADIPEPCSLVLLLGGLAGLVRQKRSHRAQES